MSKPKVSTALYARFLIKILPDRIVLKISVPRPEIKWASQIVNVEFYIIFLMFHRIIKVKFINNSRNFRFKKKQHSSTLWFVQIISPLNLNC